MEREESEEWSLLTTGQGSGLLGSAGSPDRKLELNKAGTVRAADSLSVAKLSWRTSGGRSRGGQVGSSWLEITDTPGSPVLCQL